MKDNRALEPLVLTLMNDKSTGVRQQAALALGKIEDEEAEAALIKAINDNSDNRVRETGGLIIEKKQRNETLKKGYKESG
jgi:HEAT repeat protein